MSWFLKHHDWRRQLKEDAFERFQEQATSLRLVTGQILFGPESQGGFVDLLREGRLRLYRFDETGREVVRGILEEGDLWGEPPRPAATWGDGYAEALEAAQVLRLPWKEFLQFAREAPLAWQEALRRAQAGGAERD